MLRCFEIFIIVYETENMTLASQKLFISQPAISQTIQKLEEHYQVKLFNRVKKRLRRTEDADIMYNFAKKIIKDYEDTEKFFLQRKYSTQIKIGSSITFGTVLLPSIIKNFNLSHPEIDIKVKIDKSDVIKSLLLKDTLDFAIIEGIVQNESFISEKLIDDSLIIIASNKCQPLFSNPISLELFSKQTFILREKGSGTREIIDRVISTKNISINPIWESVSTKAIINGVIENIGISILPKKLVDKELETGKIIKVSVKDLEFQRFLNIIRLRNKDLSTNVRIFIDFIKHNPVI